MPTIKTLLGEQAVIVLPGHDREDAWWVCLDWTPPELSGGGPTVAVGATPELAAGALRAEIDDYLQRAA